MDSANERISDLKRAAADAHAAAAEARAAAEEAEEEAAALRSGEADRTDSLRWVIVLDHGGPGAAACAPLCCACVSERCAHALTCGVFDTRPSFCGCSLCRQG